MLRAIKQFFTPSIFPNDEEKTRLTRVLHTMVIAFLCLLIVAGIGVAFLGARKLVPTLIFSIMVAVLLTIQVLSRRGHLQLGSFLYIFVSWGLTTILIYLGSVTSSSSLGFYLALTVITGILLGVRWAVTFAILNSFIVLVFALLEINGYPFPHLLPEPPLIRWFNFSIFLFFTITPVYLILTGLSAALNRVQQENEQRKEVEQLLRESERKFRDIANNIPGMVFQFRVVQNGSGYFDYVSPRGLELFNFVVEPNSPGYELGANIHPEDKAAFMDSINQAIETNSTWHFEGRMLNNQSNIQWVQGIASPTLVEDGLVFNGILLDVTERKQLEEQLRQAQKMEAIGRLSGGIAHDFNNILVPITGYVDLAMMSIPSDSKLYTHIQRIREAAKRAANLTSQILAFSRKQVLEIRVLNLNDVVGDFNKMVQRLIGEDIEVEILLDPALHLIKADRGQIEQVLMNLVINARDAMPTGGKLTIETANAYLDETYVKKYADTLSPGPYAMLSVNDTGHGMDAETQQQIFEPFFTTKEEGKGTGLGLATVFGIVKQHQGTIWVYSEINKGTTFKIYLPQTHNEDQLIDIPQAEPETLSGTETIMVVEDDDMVRHLVCETLAAFGYQVLEAQNSNDALQLAAEYKETLHLLLTDVVMPEMNGLELYENVVAIHPAIRVLYMSGNTDKVFAHHGIPEEGVNFLQKPFTVRSLTQKVRRILD
jgi:signal transduction histidine kinase/CheY-like chemotaxis protein